MRYTGALAETYQFLGSHNWCFPYARSCSALAINGYCLLCQYDRYKVHVVSIVTFCETTQCTSALWRCAIAVTHILIPYKVHGLSVEMEGHYLFEECLPWKRSWNYGCNCSVQLEVQRYSGIRFFCFFELLTRLPIFKLLVSLIVFF